MLNPHFQGSPHYIRTQEPCHGKTCLRISVVLPKEGLDTKIQDTNSLYKFAVALIPKEGLAGRRLPILLEYLCFDVTGEIVIFPIDSHYKVASDVTPQILK